MNLASFDIFDTTLIRRCGQPENIFFLLAWRLYPDDVSRREEFLRWRLGAGHSASARNKGRDVTIADIYSDSEIDSFCEYSASELIDAEKVVESENLTVNPSVRDVINRHRAEGYAICFISDMYLDSHFLAEVLKREHCLQDGERVYVSCECNKRKSTGLLYRHVQADLSPDLWIHYGDNRHSDIKVAKECGLDARLVTTPYSDVERQLLARHNGDFKMRLLAGLQRTARIACGNDSYSALAADFIAPLYVSYVRHVFATAREMGISRLYFLARDGYILHKIAQKACRDYPEIEVRYLHVSRKSLLLPYLHGCGKSEYLLAQDRQTIIGRPVSRLLDYLATDKVTLEKDYNIHFDYDFVQTEAQQSDFLSKMFDVACNYIKDNAESQSLLLTDYFRQEGLSDNVKIGMVDIGWIGTTRLMIDSILSRAGASKVDFFYLGVREDVLPSQYGSFVSYFSSSQLSSDLTFMIENYFSVAPEASTVGYSRSENGIVPKFADSEKFNESIVNSNVSVCQMLDSYIDKAWLDDKTMKAWASHVIDIISSLNVDIDLNPLTEVYDFDHIPFVRRMSFMQIIQYVFLGRRTSIYCQASLRLSCGRRLYVLLYGINRCLASLKCWVTSVLRNIGNGK